MLVQSTKVGDVTVTRVLEYSGPTHDPSFLLPDLPVPQIESQSDWLAPNHWIPHMGKLMLTVQLFVVHAGNEVIVIDAGVGDMKPRDSLARMHMLNTLTGEWLKAVGAGPDQVTHVALTHLHIDHVGRCTHLVDGKWEPAFPNATYHIPKLEFDHVKAGKHLNGGPDLYGASFTDSVMPVVDAGLARFLSPDDTIADLLTVEPAVGHSVGQVNFRIRSCGEEAVFSADVMHNPVQIAFPDINSGYDVLPDEARKTRHALLNNAADTGALILPMHFGAPYGGYVRRQGNGFVFEPGTWDKTPHIPEKGDD